MLYFLEILACRKGRDSFKPLETCCIEDIVPLHVYILYSKVRLYCAWLRTRRALGNPGARLYLTGLTEEQ